MCHTFQNVFDTGECFNKTLCNFEERDLLYLVCMCVCFLCKISTFITITIKQCFYDQRKSSEYKYVYSIHLIIVAL